MAGMSTRIVFMGTPEFAQPTLRLVAESYPLVGAVTQPDKPAGRGRQIQPPPIKRLAEALGLQVIQPKRLREPGVVERLSAWRPDLIVVAAFGQILPQAVLDLPPQGCLNVHASLLPRWRGPSPISAAILSGDRETGVTIMKMDSGVDTGPILAQIQTPIGSGETTGNLSERLAEIGAKLLVESLPAYLAGRLLPQPQDSSLATYAPGLKKEDGRLDCAKEAEQLERHVRAMLPRPGAFIEWTGGRLQIGQAHVDLSKESPGLGKIGMRSIIDGLPALSTSRGYLVLDLVQPAGKSPMTGKAFLNGARDWAE